MTPSCQGTHFPRSVWIIGHPSLTGYGGIWGVALDSPGNPENCNLSVCLEPSVSRLSMPLRLNEKTVGRLFRSQCIGWIHGRRATRGQEAGRHRRQPQQQDHTTQSHRVPGFDTEQEVAN